MNKQEIISHLAEDAGVTKTAAGRMLDSLTELVLDRAANGQETVLHRFGTFKPKDRAARNGRNPATGKAMLLPADRVLSFKAAKSTRDRL